MTRHHRYTVVDVFTSRPLAGNPVAVVFDAEDLDTEAMQAIDELAIEAAAHFAGVDQPIARRPGHNAEPVGPTYSLVAMPRYLNNRAASIYGGSNQIQRDIMARLVLGL